MGRKEKEETERIIQEEQERIDGQAKSRIR